MKNNIIIVIVCLFLLCDNKHTKVKEGEYWYVLKERSYCFVIKDNRGIIHIDKVKY